VPAGPASLEKNQENDLKQPTHTIPSREEILGVFRDAGTPLDAATLARALRVKPAAQEVLGRRLNAMERDGQIRANGEGIYTLANGADFVAGRISAHRDGFGFVIPDDPGADLFLNDKEMQKVLHGDRVLARVTGVDRRGRPEGTIVEVVERANTHVIGRLLNEGGVWIVSPEDQRINQDILIAGSPGKAKAGQVVSVELIEQPARFQQPTGRIVEVLGELDDPGMEIEIAVRKFGVPHVFSPAALKQANRLPNEVVDADLVDRVDLRDVPLVTIDGEDARDFDDAVYCEPVKLGAADGFRLLVAIADVSHYVKPNDALDADAIERSTSVYFPRRVIPMLPEKLSNGLCSLNPAVDRLSLVCDMVVSAEGEVQAYQFYPAVIHSAARLTYNQVAEILANPQGEEAGRRPTIVPHLQNLNGVFQALLGARHERGAIDFETTETYIVCNAMGKIEKIIPRTRNDAHRLIEECMLAANVCAADLLIRHKHPGTFRIHATPTEEKLNQLRTFLKMTGLNLGGGLKPTAGDYAALMREIKERPDAALLQTMLLRSMQQAVYSPDNVGHFGLAYEAYAHFTSPIRRYPDLLTHRAIKAVLQGKKYEPKGIDLTKLNTTVSNAARKQMAKDKAEGKAKDEKDLTVWDALGVHCSANERRADEASRDVENWLKCYFMQDKLGESFTGTVAGVTTFGIFVQLDELYVEGLVHVTELGQDYFTYDEARHQLRGERTGKTYGLTDRVVVQVAKVDLEARKIDLVLAPEGEQTLQQPAAEQAQVREAPPAGRARDGAGAPASRQGAEAEEGRSSRSKRSRRGRRERAAAREAAALAATGEGGFDASIEPDSSEAGRRSPRGIPDKKLMQTLQAEEVRKAAPVPAQLPVTEQPAAAQAEEPAPGKRPRRGRKAQPQQPAAQLDAVRQEADVSPQAPAVVTQPEPVVQAADTAPPKRARRTKKGEAQGQQQPQPQPQQVERAAAQAPAAPAAQPEAAEVAAGAGTAKRSRRSKKEQAVAEPVQQPDLPAVQEAAPGAAAPAAPKRARRAKAEPAAPAAAEAAAPAIAPGTPAAPAAEAPAKPRRKRATAALAADAAPAAGAEPVAPAAAAPAALESAPAKSAARKPAAKKTGGTTSKTSSKKEK
jgi:ribonuclease R